jgi:hypothetical protein
LSFSNSVLKIILSKFFEITTAARRALKAVSELELNFKPSNSFNTSVVITISSSLTITYGKSSNIFVSIIYNTYSSTPKKKRGYKYPLLLKI